MSNLLPPKHLRPVTPRVCATCHFCKAATYEDVYGVEHHVGVWECIRPNAPSFDVTDGEQWFYTCDRWQAADAQARAQEGASDE